MVANDFRHDETQKFFGKGRIEPCIICQFAKSEDLLCLAGLVRWRQVIFSLQNADLLGQLEAFSQRVQQDRIHIVDRGAQALKFFHG